MNELTKVVIAERGSDRRMLRKIDVGRRSMNEPAAWRSA